MLKPKVSDLVRLKPLEVRETYPSVGVYLGGMTVLVYDQEIEEILPRPLAVGDRVRHHVADLEGRILGIDGSDVWLRTETSCISVKLRNLTRINVPS